MKCFHHNDRDAVVTCNNCNKGLCSECTITIGNGNYCPNCFGDIIAYQKKLVKSLRWRLIFFGIFVVLGIISMISDRTLLNLYIPIVIGSVPIAYYYLKGTPDPYVPTSFEGAGKLMIFNFILACITGPFFAVKAFFEYRKLVSVVEGNTTLYNSVMQNL